MRYLFKNIFNGPENYNSVLVVWGVRKLKRCPAVGVARFGGSGFVFGGGGGFRIIFIVQYTPKPVLTIKAPMLWDCASVFSVCKGF